LAELLEALWVPHEVIDDCRESDARGIGSSANVCSYSVEHRAVVHLSSFLQFRTLFKEVLTIAEALSQIPLANLSADRS
jgi:hypothetical protein